jgi:hypothetical protein
LPADLLTLRGEIVCGHPDRNVSRVAVDGRVAYLKRDHLTGVRTRVRNWLAGFGPVSRCEREATTLRRLAAAGLPAPRVLAAGPGFLLIEEVPDAVPLGDIRLSAADRRVLAERLGRELAEVHAAGFGTPELAAKHALVGRDTLAVTLLDWQSSPRPGPVAVRDRVRQLANLHATVAESGDRLRCLWAYRRVWAQTGTPPRFGELARRIDAEAGKRRRRSSVRDQLRPAGSAQRLVWLAGERCCVVPEVADDWPMPADGEPFYGPPTAGEDYPLPDGRTATLVRFRTVAPLGRLVAAVRERPWRSPAAEAARVLFHLARHGLPGPTLLAFGQRLTGPASADSFVLYLPPDPADRPVSADRLAAAGLRFVGPGRVIGSPLAVRRVKR